MKLFTVKIRHIVLTTMLAALLLFVQSAAPVQAARFGQGIYSPVGTKFGEQTSLTINVGGNVSVNEATSSGATTFAGQGSHTIQVTTNDVVGYQLYVYSPTSTNMTEATGLTIPASANLTAAALASNTWGYNIDGSTNYLGMTTSPKLLKSDPGVHPSVVSTNVYYGVKTDLVQGAGIYKINVIYTAISNNE